MKRILVPLSLTLFLFSAVADSGKDELMDQAKLLEKARDRALPVVRTLARNLEGRLKEAMSEGGPTAAIKVCKEQALVLTRTVQEEHGIEYLKRIGIRIRNPQNEPDPAEQRALDYFLEKEGKNGSYPEEWVDLVQVGGRKQVRYYRSIPLQARCLPCHGPEERMPASIRSVIDRLYPEDEARGFEQGDLRGLMVVGLDIESVK